MLYSSINDGNPKFKKGDVQKEAYSEVICKDNHNIEKTMMRGGIYEYSAKIVISNTLKV
jgi:hypothetical protein